jgi:hypothetical protein
LGYGTVSAVWYCFFKHKHRRSIPPYVKEDELTNPLSLIKRMIKLPFIYPVKVSMIYSNIQLSFVDDIPIRQSISALSVCNIKEYNSNDYNVHYNNTVSGQCVTHSWKTRYHFIVRGGMRRLITNKT